MEKSYRHSPNMAARNIAGEAILVPIRNNVGDLQCIYSLNEVGAFVWERINSGQTAEELLGAVCEEFDVSPDEAKRDLEGFLAHLEQIGALIVS